jgi:recombination protein RecA
MAIGINIDAPNDDDFSYGPEKKTKIKKEITNIEKSILTKKPKRIPVNRYLTGSELLDVLVGGGEGLGYPMGKIINIVGDKSTGKTFLTCEIVAAAHYKYLDKFKWVYDDCESGFSHNTKKLYGFPIMPLDEKKRIKSPTVEESYCNVRSFFEKLKDDELGIYVIDSLDGLDSKEGKKIADEQYKRFNAKKKRDDELTDDEKKMKEKKEAGSYKMGKAKYLSQTFFPGLADLIERKNGLLIIVSQVRTNIDPFSFEKYTRAGGKALDFFCHTVLWLANINKISNKGIPIGITVKAKNTKSKTPRPYRECYLKLFFEYGLDDITTGIDYLFDFLTPKGLLKERCNGQWEDQKIMTRKALIDFIEKNNLSKELRKKVRDKWEALEESVKLNRKPKYSE